MSFIGRNPTFTTTNLTPQSADPASPVTGTLQYADGTARAAGLWSYNSGSATWSLASSTQLDSPADLENATISCSVAANALTINLRDKAGSVPSATSPVRIAFRNATLATGTYSIVSVTGALSTVISSGSTAGFRSGATMQMYVMLINNAGTAELAWSTTLPNLSGVISTTAEGGAGAADSNATIYSTTARTNVAAVLLGRLTFSLATAGTWNEVPDTIELAPLKVNPQGLVSARVYKSGGQTLSNGVETTITFDTANYDYANCFNLATGVFTAPKAGLYQFSAQVDVGGSGYGPASGSVAYVVASLNNTTEIAKYRFVFFAAATVTVANMPLPISDTVLLAQGDNVRINAFQNEGNNDIQNNTIYTYFVIRQIAHT